MRNVENGSGDGLDSGEATRLSKEIADRLKMMEFRIPAISEENTYLMDSSEQDIHGKSKVEMHYLGGRRRNIKRILLRDS